MKKTFTLFFFTLCFVTHTLFAQVEITGSKEFGRIFDLTYDANIPNKVYAITLGNHIVVSEDNGATWEILYSLIRGGSIIEDLKLSADGTVLTFSTLLQNTNLNAIMVYDIASGTISKTIPLPNREDFSYVNSYAFYDTDMDILLVDTAFPVGFNTEGKTYYTKDGGESWQMLYYTNENSNVFINKVAISPRDPNKIFLVRGNGQLEINGGLLISENAGETFEERLPGIVLDPIAFDPSDEQTIFLGTGISFGSTEENLYKSTDGGATFTTVPLEWTPSILDNITVIKFNKDNPSQLIVLEENELAISEDGGTTFQSVVYPQESPDSYYYGLNASYNPQNAQELMISSNYIPLFSEDGGTTLTGVRSSYFASTGKTILFEKEDVANLYYGVQYGHVYRDLNSGAETSFDIRGLNILSNSGGGYLADPLTPNRLYFFNASFSGSNLLVSDDNGATKRQLLSLFANYFTAVAPFPNDKNTILAAFGGFEASETSLRHIDFNDLDNVKESTIPLPKEDFINGILIDTSGKITISIGVEIYTSTDLGTSWSNESDGLEILDENDLIFDLKQDPLDVNTMALATSKGIFISSDSGATWEQKSNSIVNNVAFSNTVKGVVLASTYSSRVSEFEIQYSVDGGEAWETINNEQLLGIGSNTSAYSFDKDSVTVYVGTFDIGLMEYTIELDNLSIPGIEGNDAMFSIYPNPAADQLNFNVRDAKIKRSTIYSLSGVEVAKAGSDSSINISSLKSGIYLLRLETSKGETSFKRFIKK